MTDALQTSATADGIACKIDFADVLLSEWDEPEPEPPALDADAMEAERIYTRLHPFSLDGLRGTVGASGALYVADGVATWKAVEKCLDVLRGKRAGSYPRAEYLGALSELERAIFGEGDGGPTATL